MIRIMLILVICFAFSIASSLVSAGNGGGTNPIKQEINGFGAIVTSPAQPLYKVPKENVEKYGWVALFPGVAKGFVKMGIEIVAGAADMGMPFGNQLSEGCAFSSK